MTRPPIAIAPSLTLCLAVLPALSSCDDSPTSASTIVTKSTTGPVYEDFVTTKRRGLGLGLAISKKVVEQLGGTISVASEVNMGTTFTLRFPLTKARPSRKAAV